MLYATFKTQAATMYAFLIGMTSLSWRTFVLRVQFTIQAEGKSMNRGRNRSGYIISLIIGKRGKSYGKSSKRPENRQNRPLVKELAKRTFFFVKNLTKLLTLAWLRDRINTQVLNENARKPLSIGYLAFSLCSDILAALSVF